jgi:glycosyltransferase involved in cell wall biosynthesis
MSDTTGASPVGEVRGVVCFAGQDWWTHSAAHSDFQVSRAMAVSTPTLVVNSIGLRRPAIISGGEVDRRRIARKLRSLVRVIRRPDPSRRLWVMSPIFLPFYGAGMSWINAALVTVQVRVACLALRIRPDLVLLTLPTLIKAAVWLRPRALCYYRSDDHAAAGDVDHVRVAAAEDEAMARADVTLYSSAPLLDAERDRCRGQGVLFDHGVDLELFTLPDDVPAEPSAVFVGQFEEFSIDMDCLLEAARRSPERRFVLCGPAMIDLSSLRALPNVTVLDPVPHRDVPALLAAATVGLNPKPMNQWTEAVNPIKIKEYLAVGLAVVSTVMPVLDDLGPDVVQAPDPAAFGDAVAAAFATFSPETELEARRRRRATVATHGWPARADHLRSLFSSIVAQRTGTHR